MNQKEFMCRSYADTDTVSVPAIELQKIISDNNMSDIKTQETEWKLEKCYSANEELLAENHDLKNEIREMKNALLNANITVSKVLKTQKENAELRSKLDLSNALRVSAREQLAIERFKQPICPDYVDIKA